MFRGYGGRSLAALALVVSGVSILLFLATLIAVSRLNGQQSERRQHYPQHHAQSARQTAEIVCVGANPARVFDCVYERMAASQERAQADQDLEAQQAMANWALAMVIVTFMTALISGVGLFALLATIRQGREGLRRAEESYRLADGTAKRQLRAYLVTRNVTVKWVRVGKIPEFSVFLRNVGQTPAYEVRAIIKPFIVRGEDVNGCKVRLDKEKGPISTSIIGVGQESELCASIDDELTVSLDEEIRSGKVTLGLFGILSYRDVFQRRRLLTFKMFVYHEWLTAKGRCRLAACTRSNSAN